jgi:hypothetical protein
MRDPKDDSEQIAELADDLAEAMDEYEATGTGLAKVIRLARRIQACAGEVARRFEQAS